MKKLTKKPKYKLGDTVWMMEYNKPAERIIFGVICYANNRDEDYCYVVLEDTWDEYDSNKGIHNLIRKINIGGSWVEELDLFPTKQALIESLYDTNLED